MTIDPEIAEVYERRLSPEEFDARVKEAIASLDGPEGEQIAELIRWFQRRYPTPQERLAYCRRRIREITEASHRPRRIP